MQNSGKETSERRTKYFAEYDLEEFDIVGSQQHIIANRWAMNRTHVEKILSKTVTPMYIYVLTIPNTGNTQLLYDLSATTGYLPESWYAEKTFGRFERGPDGRHFHFFEDDPRTLGLKRNLGVDTPIFCKAHGMHTILRQFESSTIGFITTYRNPIDFWDARRRGKNPPFLEHFHDQGELYFHHFHSLLRDAESSQKILILIPFEAYVRDRINVLDILFHRIPAFQEIFDSLVVTLGAWHGGDRKSRELKKLRKPGKFGEYVYDHPNSNITDLTWEDLNEFMQKAHRMLEYFGYPLDRGEYIFQDRNSN